MEDLFYNKVYRFGNPLATARQLSMLTTKVHFLAN